MYLFHRLCHCTQFLAPQFVCRSYYKHIFKYSRGDESERVRCRNVGLFRLSLYGVLADDWSRFYSDVDLLKAGVEDWERNGGRWRTGEYMQKVYDKVDWVFALLAAASVGVQGVKTVTTPESRLNEQCKSSPYPSLFALSLIQ